MAATQVAVISPLMAVPFPFQIAPLPHPTPERQLAVFADVGGLEEYYQLFLDYGFGGTAACWAEHLETIVEEHQPALLEELEFTSGGLSFIVCVPSQAVAEQFLGCVLPFFGSVARLQKYLAQADPGDFFE